MHLWCKWKYQWFSTVSRVGRKYQQMDKYTSTAEQDCTRTSSNQQDQFMLLCTRRNCGSTAESYGMTFSELLMCMLLIKLSETPWGWHEALQFFRPWPCAYSQALSRSTVIHQRYASPDHHKPTATTGRKEIQKSQSNHNHKWKALINFICMIHIQYIQIKKIIRKDGSLWIVYMYPSFSTLELLTLHFFPTEIFRQCGLVCTDPWW